MSRRLAVVVETWPCLYATAIAHEIAGLEARGFDIHLVSLHPAVTALRHPVHGAVRAPLTLLPGRPLAAPRRWWRAWCVVRRWPGYRAARAVLQADLARLAGRDRRRRRRCFNQAMIMAAELPPAVPHIHVHGLAATATVGRDAALLRGIGFSLSAHGGDGPAWELRDKLEAAAFTVCCTRQETAALQDLSMKPVTCQHHGLAADTFERAAASSRDGTDPRHPVRLLCVARLVAGKGHEDLLAALAQLPGSLAWRLDLIGDGPLRGKLATLARRLKLDGRVTFHGAKVLGDVAAAYACSDLAVLAGRNAGDGLPQAVVEAQGVGLAVVAARLPAIAELVEHDVTGLLVEPGDRAGLARAIAALIVDPVQRQALAAAGAARVALEFDAQSGFDRLAARLRPLVVGRR
ncbi:glycosyltransferase [Oleomonas cavernae]|uniref:Glycosyltransferase n=1 Tax=Oleomonas cavernae TaxID=2320859 RepID=A0A418WG11_9PROT|nr:glycosyltransferase [Oleomonas cavernae]RJF88920.1 glycosyltransferase [Oleomonas cavernae]